MKTVEFTFHSNFTPNISDKIKVIRAFRNATRQSLREAKELVEASINVEVRVRMTAEQFGVFIAAMISDNQFLPNSVQEWFVTKVLTFVSADSDTIDLTV